MQSKDIVQQLAVALPRHTSLFGRVATISNVSVVGTAVTVTTAAPHGFNVGKAVSISGVQTGIPIASITRVGSIATIVTSSDTDLTQLSEKTVSVYGANEPEFNGTFTIVTVTNRKTIMVNVENTGPSAATGTMVLTNGASVFQQFNGYYEIATTPNATSFTITLPIAIPYAPILSDASAQSAIRVAGTADIERALLSYTKQEINNLWMFVSLGDVNASKDRAILSDAVSNTQRSQFFRQQIIQSVNIYTIMPASAEISGRDARDMAELVFAAICKSILFKRFDTNLFVGQYNPLQFVAHGTEQYNAAYYVHRYTFEQVAPLQFEDTVGYDADVAFTDIHLDMGVSTGTAVLTADIHFD